MENLLNTTRDRLLDGTTSSLSALEEYTSMLEAKVLELLNEREKDWAISKASAECTFAKNTAGRVLTALFDHALAGRAEGLKTWWETGSIQTRNGPAHWRLDPREIRDKRGFNLMHNAVDRHLANENLKVATVELLIDVMGFDVNAFGRTSLHYAALNGYADLVKLLLHRQANPHIRDKAGLTPLATLQQTTLTSAFNPIVSLLVAHAEKPSMSSEDNNIFLTSALVAISRLVPFIDLSHREVFAKRIEVFQMALDSDMNLVPWQDIIVEMLGLEELIFTVEAYSNNSFATLWGAQKALHSHQDHAWAAYCSEMLHRCQRSNEPSSNRTIWHYAVLSSAAAQPYPLVSVEKGSAVGTTPSANIFPLNERILIGTGYYWITMSDATTITLDRSFEGLSSSSCPTYVANDLELQPYVHPLSLHERTPGNPFETNSSEEDMIQDYQVLDPESSQYELRLRVGPATSRAKAKELVKEWRQRCRDHFNERECLSLSNACASYCPQRQGERMCVDSMEAVGKELAKKHFGRATFAKA
ncbi:hypothetical protein THRCLA_04309, partial [Thraustotheca clavata]